MSSDKLDEHYTDDKLVCMSMSMTGNDNVNEQSSSSSSSSSSGTNTQDADKLDKQQAQIVAVQQHIE